MPRTAARPRGFVISDAEPQADGWSRGAVRPRALRPRPCTARPGRRRRVGERDALHQLGPRAPSAPKSSAGPRRPWCWTRWRGGRDALHQLGAKIAFQLSAVRGVDERASVVWCRLLRAHGPARVGRGLRGSPRRRGQAAGAGRQARRCTDLGARARALGADVDPPLFCHGPWRCRLAPYVRGVKTSWRQWCYLALALTRAVLGGWTLAAPLR